MYVSIKFEITVDKLVDMENECGLYTRWGLPFQKNYKIDCESIPNCIWSSSWFGLGGTCNLCPNYKKRQNEIIQINKIKKNPKNIFHLSEEDFDELYKITFKSWRCNKCGFLPSPFNEGKLLWEKIDGYKIGKIVYTQSSEIEKIKQLISYLKSESVKKITQIPGYILGGKEFDNIKKLLKEKVYKSYCSHCDAHSRVYDEWDILTNNNEMHDCIYKWKEPLFWNQ